MAAPGPVSTPGPAFERHFTATAYVVSRGRTLLLWHRKLGMWLPPGGHCEANEDPVQAAVREAREEAGLDVAVIHRPDLLAVQRPVVLPPPEVILVEDIVQAGQPFHQHIDHVYFTAAAEVDFSAPVPGGEHRWLTREAMADAFSLPAADGTLVAVAEDVRLLGLRAIAAALEFRPA
jgi:8-oxo-dGTP pyrophosphatase MutT (NUDIX family)